MRVKECQNLVFNRTGRVDIPSSFVKRHVESGKIVFDGLHSGEWSGNINPEDFNAAVLYIDINSLFFSERHKVALPRRVLTSDWNPLEIEVPRELTNGDYRVKIAVSIAFPPGHSDGGRVLARTAEIVVINGPDGEGDAGGSLLKVRPAPDDIPDLCRLEISDPEGPVLVVNSKVPGFSWRDLATDPRLRLSVFSGYVREILIHLALHPESVDTWGQCWMALDGIRGRELPELDPSTIAEAYLEARDWAEAAAEAMLETLNIVQLFVDSIPGNGGDQ